MTTEASGTALAGSSLNAKRRGAELEAATDGRAVDVLVVGLGVTGAGVALDAASRGLDVVAVDAHDLAFGTSRWSSKMVHGGLRYLAKGQVGIARESAVERHVLMTSTAPHLVRSLPMMMPLVPTMPRSKAALVAGGIVAVDLLRAAARTPRSELPRPRWLSAQKALAMAPALRSRGLRGGLLYWDGQLEDDARLTVAVARTAAAHGARILTRCRVLELDGEGALIRDERTGAALTVKARAVVNAAGVWAGGLVEGVALRPSRGTHLLVRGSSLGLAVGVAVPVPDESNRYVFALPQTDGLLLVGLTDEPTTGAIPDVPQPSEAEIATLVRVIGGALEIPLERRDVVGAFAGLRPLLDSEGKTCDLSRRHAVLTSPAGVVTVVGGKLTTYRRMAEDAVDAVIALRRMSAGPCRTRHLPLVGAADRATLASIDAPRRLVRRYGTEAVVLARDRTLTAPVTDGLSITMAELVWAVRHEGALKVDDLLDRRTRVGLVPADRALALPAAEHALSSQPGSARGLDL